MAAIVEVAGYRSLPEDLSAMNSVQESITGAAAYIWGNKN